MNAASVVALQSTFVFLVECSHIARLAFIRITNTKYNLIPIIAATIFLFSSNSTVGIFSVYFLSTCAHFVLYDGKVVCIFVIIDSNSIENVSVVHYSKSITCIRSIFECIFIMFGLSFNVCNCILEQFLCTAIYFIIQIFA